MTILIPEASAESEIVPMHCMQELRLCEQQCSNILHTSNCNNGDMEHPTNYALQSECIKARTDRIAQCNLTCSNNQNQCFANNAENAKRLQEEQEKQQASNRQQVKEALDKNTQFLIDGLAVLESQNKAIYKAIRELEDGSVYSCYCPPESWLEGYQDVSLSLAQVFVALLSYELIAEEISKHGFELAPSIRAKLNELSEDSQSLQSDLEIRKSREEKYGHERFIWDHVTGEKCERFIPCEIRVEQ